MKESVQSFCQTYLTERKGTNALKWDALKERFGDENLTPMWVADMEFKAPEATRKVLVERAEHGVFGYSIVPDTYYDTCFKWQKERYGARSEKEWVRFSTGVVNSLYHLIHALTKEKDSVMIIEPVYYPFSHSINDTGRNKVVSNLVCQDGVYTMDFADIEKQIIAHDVKLLIHCSPHNPVGRVWSKEEMVTLFDICVRHDVRIICDEIHQDITQAAYPFIAALSLDEKYDEHVVVVNAPSKTFNLACLLHSHILLPGKTNRTLYDAYMKQHSTPEISIMGLLAAEASYANGGEWLAGLLEVIDENDRILRTILAEKAPEIMISEREGTYLAWLDLRAYVKPKDTKHFVQDLCGIAIDFGEWFGKGYEGFIRINLATDPKYIKAAAEAIAREVTL